MCPPDEVSEDGLAPCFKCPRGFFQPERGRRHCLRSAAQKKEYPRLWFHFRHLVSGAPTQSAGSPRER